MLITLLDRARRSVWRHRAQLASFGCCPLNASQQESMRARTSLSFAPVPSERRWTSDFGDQHQAGPRDGECRDEPGLTGFSADVDCERSGGVCLSLMSKP